MMKRLFILALALYLFYPIFGCGKGNGSGPEGSGSANPVYDQLSGQWFAETPNQDGEIIVLRFENAADAHHLTIEAIRPTGEKAVVDSGTFSVNDARLDFALTKMGELSLQYAVETTPHERLTIGQEVYVKVGTQGPTLSGQVQLTQLSADEFVTVSSVVPPHIPGEIIVRSSRSSSQALASGGQALAIRSSGLPAAGWKRIILPMPKASALALKSKNLGERLKQYRGYENEVQKIEKEALAKCRREGNHCSYNVIVKPSGLPNDPKWDDQWNMKMLNMLAVFDDEAGQLPAPSQEKVIVAVIDTGIVSNHPDFAQKILRSEGRIWGYDFVTHEIEDAGTGEVIDDNFSLDGDGPDPDPTDAGDERDLEIPDTISSWHGTHLAGIIAAARDNGAGVAGMNQNVWILPIRAVGRNGNGTTYDVTQAILYACRLPNVADCLPSVQKDAAGNPVLDASGYQTPVPGDDGNYLDESTCNYTFRRSGVGPLRPVADVVNLSLGLAMSIDDAEVMIDAINACLQTNDPQRKPPLFIAAAGNDHLGAGYCFDEATLRFVANPNCQFYPAAHQNVLSIGAVSGGGAFASSYSNYGPRQWVVAPGGSSSQGVVSAVHPNAADGYWGLMGTSQAAAHVSGLASLLYSHKPELSRASVANIIADSAIYLGNAAEGDDDQYGHGLINPRGALFSALGLTPQGEPKLTPSADSLDFGTYGENATVILYNSGGGTLELLEFPVTTDDGADWLTVQSKKLDDPTGTAPWGLQIHVDRSKVSEGEYKAKVSVKTGGGRKEIDIAMKVASFSLAGATEVDNLIRRATNLLNGTPGFQNRSNFGEVYVFAVNTDTDAMFYVKTNFEANYNFYMMVPAGKYQIVAGVDGNNDQKICTDQDSICLGFPTFIQPQTIDCTDGCRPGNIAITY
ncbi:MAG: S8 family serine peptidase [Deltaproteobacteria bacterium]|nr:S8 family serine peptidase [Deltaproteobacteria bacterium]